MIILKRRHIEAEIDHRVGLSGEYKLILRHGDGTIKIETDWFDNLLLDPGLNAMGTIAAIVGCAIGTGTTAPAASQTALVAFSAYTTTIISQSETPQAISPYFSTRTITFRFALGALNGNYSEVGVGWNSTNMFSRALIVDGVGAATTITVTSAEQLDVVYRLKVYSPTADVVGAVTISGVSYNMTGRAAEVTAALQGQSTGATPIVASYPFDTSSLFIYSGQIGVVTATPAGSSTGYNGTLSDTSYVNNSLVRQCVYSVPLTTVLASNAPMKSFKIKTNGLGNLQLQYQFEKVSDGTGIPKDTNKTLSMTFQVGWGRRP